MRRVIAWVAVGLAMPGQAAAAPKPTRLTMKRVEGTNLHIANNQGAIHWQAAISISVDLLPAGKLAAVSTGTRGEHNLYVDGAGGSYTTEDQTGWTTTWTGTWSARGDRLQLALVLVDDRCKHDKTMTGAAAETLACKATSKQAELACTSETITLEDPAGSKAQRALAWRCTAKTADDLGESPSQWVLGKTVCIQTVGGRMTAEGFQPCTP
jgi:hypothetical protein